jgi:outer membrane protein TolC
MTRPAIAATVGCWLLLGSSALAQQPSAGGQTFRLRDLQEAAIEADPRVRELELQTRQTDLRVRNITAARLPAITATAQAQYQSDVPTAPFTLPNGQAIFSPPKASYDAFLRVDQSLFDATIGAQTALERAQLAEAQARVKTALFTLRQQVNDAFFGAASIQARAAALDATIADLDARLKDTNARVQGGAAVPADAAILEATLLERQEDADALRADRRAALARLAKLVGQPIRESDTLALPDLAAAVAAARQQADVEARPEYDQFARTHDRLARQQDLAAARTEPRLSAFGRAGYGRPGLNFISDHGETYGVAGVQLQWTAWTWGSPGRERAALAAEQEIVAAERAAFTKTLNEGTESDLAEIDHLQTTLGTDDRIIALREQVERTAQVRFQENAVTASDYVDRSLELLQARIARGSHEVDLARARARLLTTLGLEVR